MVKDPMSRDAHPLRILVVDDDAAVRGVLRVIFHREGWAVLEAVDGLDAIEQMRLAEPDVIILDLLLPRMGGVELLEHLKKTDAGHCARTIVLTAVAESHLRKLPLDLPMWKLMRKPFDIPELIHTVRSCGGSMSLSEAL
jgi:CheY-like chemotaxis protein